MKRLFLVLRIFLCFFLVPGTMKESIATKNKKNVFALHCHAKNLSKNLSISISKKFSVSRFAFNEQIRYYEESMIHPFRVFTTWVLNHSSNPSRIFANLFLISHFYRIVHFFNPFDVFRHL